MCSIIGKDNLDETLLNYYDEFKFTHPTPNDIKRTAEKVSGLQLEWYLNYWVSTVNVIDYAVTAIEEQKIILERKGIDYNGRCYKKSWQRKIRWF